MEARTGARLGRDFTLESLKAQGFAAVFLGIGAHASLKLGIPGEDGTTGVVDAVRFLREVNSGVPPAVGAKLAVIGGGNVAVDAARAARRLGARQVTLVYRRSAAEMPAYPEEIKGRRRKGSIRIYGRSGANPGRGRCGVRLTCLRTQLGAADESGRRRPVPVAARSSPSIAIRSSPPSASGSIAAGPKTSRRSPGRRASSSLRMPARSRPACRTCLSVEMRSADRPPSSRLWPPVIGRRRACTAFSRGSRWRQRPANRRRPGRRPTNRTGWISRRIRPRRRGSMEASWNRRDACPPLPRRRWAWGKKKGARAEAPPLPQLRGLLRVHGMRGRAMRGEGREPRDDRDHRNLRGGGGDRGDGFQDLRSHSAGSIRLRDLPAGLHQPRVRAPEQRHRPDQREDPDEERPAAAAGGHRPLRGFARRALPQVLLAGLLHVLHEVRPPGAGEDRR